MEKVIEECPDDISPVEMEECVNNKVYEENEKNDEEKEENETIDSESNKIDEGKVVNDERGDGDASLVEEAEFSSRPSS